MQDKAEDTLIGKIRSEYNLSNSQSIAFEKLINFLRGPDKEFTLSGLAGTGKTFLLRLIIHYYQKSNVYENDNWMVDTSGVIGMTISHKAKLVLAESIPNSFTVASALGMKAEYSRDGEVTFVMPDRHRNPPPIKDAGLIIVDETSMISKKVRKFILDSAKPYAKIIYVGDRHQLPPIEKDRKVGEDSVTFSLKNTFELKELIRQEKGNPIIDFSHEIASAIDDYKGFGFIVKYKGKFDHKKGFGIYRTDKDKAIDSYISYLEKMYSENLETIIDRYYICYRNESVNYMNTLVRNLLFPDINQKVVARDRLVMTANNTSKIGAKVYNSEVHTVEFVDTAHFRNVECYSIKLVGVEGQFYCPTEKGEEKFNMILREKKNEALKLKDWFEYYKFKDAFFYFDYAFAINSHRAQGSTYENVYVDMSDILSVGPIPIKEKLQSLYVAITRARKAVALF